ncbi:unnamed protein product [Cylindrotheca closterium]|uniref:Uncharacterized protein n=1 Tax=Cylindrotheca closterium TaxID=2856 RepID=A0AAD2FTH7_9STRA|nr:unnamed protein product [Cylindrotheca closterium]
MQGDALGFMHRMEDGTTLDDSSRQEDDSTGTAECNEDDDAGFDADIANDVFWRVHGNKCMTLKFSQAVVSRLTEAAQAEVDREAEYENKSTRKFGFHHNSVAEEDP